MYFYWIDALNEYDKSISDGVMKAFEHTYKPYAKEYGLEFKYIDTNQLIVASLGKEDAIYYHGKNILKEKAKVYISYTNYSHEIDKTQETIVRIADNNKNWEILNCTSKGILIDKDKLYGISLVRNMKIPTIPTVQMPSRKYARSFVSEIEKILGKYPYIIKPKELLGGYGIMKIDSTEMLKSSFDNLGRTQMNYLIQSFISEAKDYRIYMEGGRYLACFERTAPKNCYLASISQSGIGRAITPPDELIKMSSKIAKELTTGYICIDWLAAKGNFWFSEIESGGAFWGLPKKERKLVAKSFFLSKREGTCYELR